MRLFCALFPEPYRYRSRYSGLFHCNPVKDIRSFHCPVSMCNYKELRLIAKLFNEIIEHIKENLMMRPNYNEQYFRKVLNDAPAKSIWVKN